jgi:general stress protein 26
MPEESGCNGSDIMKTTETEKFHELLESFSTAVLITHGHETHFHSRPMAIARVDEDCDLWFITADDSAKVHEIEADNRVQVVCQDGWTSCVSIAGHAALSRNRAKIHELWKASYQAWFPLGKDDPNILLIRVAGEQGEHWDNKGMNRFSYIFQSLKAIVNGKTPEIEEGSQHGKVTLTPTS